MIFLKRTVTRLSNEGNLSACPVFGSVSNTSSMSEKRFSIDETTHSGICQCSRPFNALTVSIIAAGHRWSDPAVWALAEIRAFVHGSSLNKMKSIRFTFLELVAVLLVEFRISQMYFRLRSAHRAESSGDLSSAW